MSEALPDRWCAARLAELASVQLGKMLSAKAKTGRGARPYLRNVNVRWHRIDVGDVFEMDFDPREEEKYQLLSGDVLVCEGGEPGRAAVWSNQLPGALYQKALHRVRFTGECVEPRYFTYFLELAAAEGLLAKRFTGSTIKHLPREAFLEVPIPVAPAAEQRRIVAALEEHLSELDAAEAGLERARANGVRLRDSVIANFVLGREVSDALGSSCDASKWEWHELRTIGELKGGITKGQKRRDGDKLRAVPYLRVANVQRGHLELSEMKTIEATEAEIAELRLEDGDVLFNEGGDRDKLGRGWVWHCELPECIHQNHVFRFRPDARRVDSRFVSYYGNSHGQRYFLEQGKQTTNLASINLTKLGALPVPLPPLSVQKAIVAAIDAAVSSAERAIADIDTQLLRATRLRQSILKHAFEGKLVPQDPNDEPASVLLDRIRVEHEKDAPRAPKSRAKAKTARRAPRR